MTMELNIQVIRKKFPFTQRTKLFIGISHLVNLERNIQHQIVTNFLVSQIKQSPINQQSFKIQLIYCNAKSTRFFLETIKGLANIYQISPSDK